MSDIQHDTENCKFLLTLGEKQGHLSYIDKGSGVLDFVSTFVPPEGRGQGVARRLTDEAVEYAKTKKLKVIPSCSYVQKYFDDRPELKDLLA